MGVTRQGKRCCDGDHAQKCEEQFGLHLRVALPKKKSNLMQEGRASQSISRSRRRSGNQLCAGKSLSDVGGSRNLLVEEKQCAPFSWSGDF